MPRVHLDGFGAGAVWDREACIGIIGLQLVLAEVDGGRQIIQLLVQDRLLLQAAQLCKLLIYLPVRINRVQILTNIAEATQNRVGQMQPTECLKTQDPVGSSKKAAHLVLLSLARAGSHCSFSKKRVPCIHKL